MLHLQKNGLGDTTRNLANGTDMSPGKKPEKSQKNPDQFGAEAEEGKRNETAKAQTRG